MTVKDAVKIAAIKAHKNMPGLAKAMDISTPTLYRKMNGESSFTVKEIELGCEYLELDSPMGVFFIDKLA